MTLANGKDILGQAYKNKCAVGGFDAFNMESAQAIIAAAEQAQSPVFLQACIVSLQHTGIGYAAALLKEAARSSSVPVCLHVDHGPEVSDVMYLEECMDAGFNSIMVDGSMLPLEENIELTKEVVTIAHKKNVCVEGELGHVSRNTSAGREEIENLMTDPDTARLFVDKTGIDYLAVSVGSVSGFFQGQIELDIERLNKIKEKVNVPLIFHGGTSIPENQLKQAVPCGVSKVNIAHGVRKAFWDGVMDAAEKTSGQKVVDPRPILRQGREDLKNYVLTKIDQLRSK